jgi:hypothetical protein
MASLAIFGSVVVALLLCGCASTPGPEPQTQVVYVERPAEPPAATRSVTTSSPSTTTPTVSRSSTTNITISTTATLASTSPTTPTASTTTTASTTAKTTPPACAENKSCNGDISKATGRPKTVYVRGYCRKDGVCVKGHYRSAPSRKTTILWRNRPEQSYSLVLGSRLTEFLKLTNIAASA